jgi:hypothetical protein
MADFLADLNSVKAAELRKLHWVVSDLPVQVAKSQSDDTVVTINLVETLEKGQNRPKDPDDSNVFWFPHSWSFNDVNSMLVKACQQAGFPIRQKGADNKKAGAFKCICSHWRGRQSKVSHFVLCFGFCFGFGFGFVFVSVSVLVLIMF